MATSIDKLGDVLFGGEIKIVDIKVAPGTDTYRSPEERAQALLDSMERMKITKRGVLVKWP